MACCCVKSRKTNYQKPNQGLSDKELLTTSFAYFGENESLENIPYLFIKLRQTYNIQSHDDLQLHLKHSPSKNVTIAAFNKAIILMKNDVSTVDSSFCSSCSKQVRVEDVQSFKNGQHIAMPGKKPVIGQFYQHHAIVKNVKQRTGTKVELELIHFTDVKDGIKKYSGNVTFDLSKDEIMIIEYPYQKYSDEEIVRRAENLLLEKQNSAEIIGSYCPLTNNCEHLATWCAFGEKQSLQVSELRHKIEEALKNLSGPSRSVGRGIVKGIVKLLFDSADELVDIFAKELKISKTVLTVEIIIYLVYCIIMTVLLKDDYNESKLCWRCFKGKLIDLWAAFGLFCGTSLVTFFIFNFALPLLGPTGIPLTVLIIVLSALLQWNVPRLRRALQSPFNVDSATIRKLLDLDVGDVITISYYGFNHDVIVTEVRVDTGSSVEGKIRCIHYGLKNLFATREISEDEFSVSLNTTTIKRYDFRHLDCYSPEDVVRRARSRIGETKWGMLSNRSDHLCFWAKVKQRPHDLSKERNNNELKKSESEKLSALLVTTEEVHLMEEIQNGDVLKHKTLGIISGLRSLDGKIGRQFEFKQIIYDSGWIVRSQAVTVDLNKDTIYVNRYHPAHCHSMKTRVRRAKQLLNQTGTWWTTDGFIQYCIMLNP